MISHRCRYKARGSVLMRVFTSSSVRWVAARVTLAISSLFSFQSSPPLFYHSTRISITHFGDAIKQSTGLARSNDRAGDLRKRHDARATAFCCELSSSVTEQVSHFSPHFPRSPRRRLLPH